MRTTDMHSVIQFDLNANGVGKDSTLASGTMNSKVLFGKARISTRKDSVVVSGQRGKDK